MSELIETRNNTKAFRWSLLASVSAAALIATSCGAIASDGDADRPTVWIELGGQLERLNGQGKDFWAPFLAANADTTVFNPVSPTQAANAPGYSYGGEGKVSFEPQNSDWVFSASVLYGRSGNNRVLHNQTFPLIPPSLHGFFTPGGHRSSFVRSGNYAHTTAKHEESHAIIDFQAGRDVGIGAFGPHGSSVISAGLRFAQFSNKGDIFIRARPDLQFYGFYFALVKGNVYQLQGDYQRAFRGIGPTLSWDGNAALLGQSETMEMSLDWGAKVAVLFGRQKARNVHQTTSQKRFEKYRSSYVSGHYVTNYKTGKPNSRMHSVVVPNLDGFAALSFRYTNAKVSFGYRADFFFGAIDGGIDARENERVGFFGPYATVSVGLGG